MGINHFKKSILLVEDNEAMRIVLESFLQKHFSVIARPTAVDALTYLFQGNFPDLILLDLSLPGISGMELLAELKTNQFFQHLPILIISGQAAERWADEARQMGVTEHLQKPFDPQLLLSKINVMLQPTCI